jgi:hypothetical protein
VTLSKLLQFQLDSSQLWQKEGEGG